MRFSSCVTFAALLTGCGGGPISSSNSCSLDDQVFVWLDEDGDGFGAGAEAVAERCAPLEGEATNNADCDDSNGEIHPDAIEICDAVDNDCDGQLNEDTLKRPWFADDDGDGYGGVEHEELACVSPGPGWVELSGDCDDTNAALNPGAVEICNGGIDDDCNTLADNDDFVVDPATAADWFPDVDGDGFGDMIAVPFFGCDPEDGRIDNDLDCNDAEAAVAPGALEVCDELDNDCDGLFDDEDPDLDPAGQVALPSDADGDGLGDAVLTTLVCRSTPGIAVDNVDDCNDSDPEDTIIQDWVADLDFDGHGFGPVVFPAQCDNPGIGFVPASAVEDCDDTNSEISPSGLEICGDDIDQDCDGVDEVCFPIGSFNVSDGPNWSTNPVTYTCLEACALLFGGVDTDYECSTSLMGVDNLAFSSSWGIVGCGTVDQDFKVNVNYNCGAAGCATSAYVTDNCTSDNTNFCW